MSWNHTYNLNWASAHSTTILLNLVNQFMLISFKYFDAMLLGHEFTRNICDLFRLVIKYKRRTTMCTCAIQTELLEFFPSASGDEHFCSLCRAKPLWTCMILLFTTLEERFFLKRTCKVRSRSRIKCGDFASNLVRSGLTDLCAEDTRQHVQEFPHLIRDLLRS